MQLFDSVKGELHRGVNLVEASAGTGKTYAISMLVLRFITERAIPIDQVLVVTFTKAATEELKERIRSRIIEGRNLLLCRTAVDDQEIMGQWATGVEQKELTIELLNQALLDIDKASIYTIHGFCQRMLQEQALESGQLFEMDLVPDINQTRIQVVEDFWRETLYRLVPTHCAIITSRFANPEELLFSIKDVSAVSDTPVKPRVKALDSTFSDFDQAYGKVSEWFELHQQNLERRFIQSIGENKFKSGFASNFPGWWQTLCDYFSGNGYELPDNLQYLSRDQLCSQLDGRRIRGEERKVQYLRNWPFPEDELKEFGQAIDRIILGVRVTLFHQLKKEVDRRLKQLGAISFNDLVVRLSVSLKSANGKSLHSLLAKRYCVGLIDEFQDTDSAQYHIFSTLFSDKNQYLYLIGDPKQAIYKFRGADIFSYFRAKEAADHHLTLDTNYRSHPALIDAVNCLFGPRNDPFFFEMLPYHPVNPARKDTDFYLAIDGCDRSSMVYCHLPPPSEGKNDRWSSGRASEYILSFVISEVIRLLHGEQSVTIGEGDQHRPLTAKDIGILVRTNKQADQYQRAFARAGIPSIIASRQSVFNSRECEQLLALMRSLNSPNDIQRLKNGLALDWFGFNGQDLHRLFHDAGRFDQFISRFHSYSLQWRQQGFGAMMTTLIEKERVYKHLATTEMAQRRLTNIHHLLELIQEVESLENFGPDQILLWLQAMRDENQSSDETELRLESDEETIKIVTMHSAKGLEYPVVFCPVLWYRANRLKNEKYQISCHSENNEMLIDLGSEDFERYREKAIQEEMAEELRLFYVAVTRASLRCYTIWADVKSHMFLDDSFHSSFGYLCFPDGQCTFEEQQRKLNNDCLDGGGEYRLISVETENDLSGRVEIPEPQVHLQARQLSERSVQSDRMMSSYSALAALSIEKIDNDYDDEGDLLSETDDVAEQVLELPAGPQFGNVVHELLEKISFQELAKRHEYLQEIQQECSRYGVRVDQESLLTLLFRTVTTPLLISDSNVKGEGVRLCQLDDAKLMKEMGFYFNLSKSTTSMMNDVLANEPTFSPLSHRSMEGYLTGFIDLVFQWEGRFYILDYKTNLLGQHYGDYDQHRMIRSLRSHNYGLQYWIYTLVLHQHLSRWFPGYDYQQHFGGVLYLFVRGMVPDRPANGVFYTLPDPDVLQKLSSCLGGGVNA